MNLSEHQIKVTAAWMHDAANRLEVYASYCLKPETPAMSAGPSNSRVSGGEVSDPTGNQATNATSGSKWLTIQQAHLAANITTALDVSQAIVEGTGRIYAHITPPEAAPFDPTEECRQGCGQPRATGRQGNCNACAQWLGRNLYTDGTKRDSVPADVIQRRNEVRSKRRMKTDDTEAVA